MRPGARTPRTLSSPWLGARRGYLADWVTQRWVELTGRRVDTASCPWLDAPIGDPRGIGTQVFAEHAREKGLELREGDGAAGLLPDFAMLRGPSFDPERVHRDVIDFYEATAAYELDAWAHWSGWFRPFGGLLAALFSRRLQQLNVPLTGLDTSRGMTSTVVPMIDPATGEVRSTAWVRTLAATGDVIYAGSYSAVTLPGAPDPCVKVAFPLPNGNALVFMRPEVLDDGSFRILSEGERFGDPGFYFTIDAGDGRLVARHVRSFRESIHVYAMPDGPRADHVLTLWGRRFLEIHYRMRRRRATFPETRR